MSEDPTKVAVITGGRQGIGRACADILLAHGYTVEVGDHQFDDTVVADLGENQLIYRHLDVSDQGSVDRWAGEVIEEHGRVDVVVNNAGVWLFDDIAAVSEADARRVVDVNLLGTWRVTQAMLPALGPGSALVNMSSTVAMLPATGIGLYPATKGAIQAMTRTWAVELASRGVRVNAVAPGFVRTPTTQPAYEGGMRDTIASALPIPRAGVPDDIAQAVLFLAGPQSSYITGQVLTVDGGMTLVGMNPAAATSSTDS
jgi:3-oxoacyl-[acyl-carrier protein] reductase